MEPQARLLQVWHSHSTAFPEDETFGPAIPLFHSTLAAELDTIARYQRWSDLVVFMEFAGKHLSNDPKSLYLLDVAPHQQGVLGPVQFLKLFADLPHPAYLGYQVWDAAIAASSLPGISFEGVVGKLGERYQLRFVKAKSPAWIDDVHTRSVPKQSSLLI